MRASPRTIQASGSCRCGFTLTEILVVLAALSVLAMLAAPAVLHARDQARTVSCAGKLMQIGLALSQYIEDDGGRYPSVFAPAHNCIWAARLEPYVKQTSLFECPADPTAEYRTGCPTPSFGVEPLVFFHGSYTINHRVNALRIRNLTHPESFVTIVDGKESPFHDVDPGTALLNGMQGLLDSAVAMRHGDGANLLFADRHVKWLRPAAMADRSLWYPGTVPVPTPAAP